MKAKKHGYTFFPLINEMQEVTISMKITVNLQTSNLLMRMKTPYIF